MFVDCRTTHTIVRKGCKHLGKYKGRLFTLKSQAPFEPLITAIVLFQWSLTTSISFLAQHAVAHTAVLFWCEGEEPGNGKSERVTTHFFFPLCLYYISGLWRELLKGPTGKVSVVWWGVALSPSTWTLFSSEGLVWNRFSRVNNLLLVCEPSMCHIPWILLSRLSKMLILNWLVTCSHFVTNAEPALKWIYYTVSKETRRLTSWKLDNSSAFFFKRSQDLSVRKRIDFSLLLS